MSTVSAESRPNLYFRDYLLESVYLRTSEAQRAEILTLYRNAGAGIQGADAERSSHEAVYLIRAPSGELAGVSTVALVRVKGGLRFYSSSLFIRPRDRVPFLMVAVLNATRDFLRNFKHPVMQPVGMLIVNENPKLMRPGIRRAFVRNGYKYWGQSAAGEDVWVAEFAMPDTAGVSLPSVDPTMLGNEGC